LGIFDLEKHILAFLSKHLGDDSPVLVGFSGGVDSFSLLHALRNEQRRVVAVHLDHGWREESSSEAELLRKHVAPLGVEFVCYRLPKAPEAVNLEDWSRTQRYLQFHEVSRKLGIHSILLAHQSNDQVETVIKRFLEGSAIPKLRGMRQCDKREGLHIFRPLLGVSKAALEEYARAHDIPYIVDPSNSDLSYLRARMRHHIIPSLEKSFGKRIQQSILSLAQEAQELETYLASELERSFEFFETKDLVVAQARKDRTDPYLARQLIRFLVEKRGFPPLSRQQVSRAAAIFCSQSRQLSQFGTKTCRMRVQGGVLCIVPTGAVEIERAHCSSIRGSLQMGIFDIRWEEAIFQEQPRVDWVDLCKGRTVTIYVPSGSFDVCKVTSDLLSTASRRLISSTVLRSLIPGIVQGFRLVGDFLSGYTVSLNKGDRCCGVVLRTKN
jgi:tRNA(Ile)-lysidine synthase